MCLEDLRIARSVYRGRTNLLVIGPTPALAIGANSRRWGVIVAPTVTGATFRCFLCSDSLGVVPWAEINTAVSNVKPLLLTDFGQIITEDIYFFGTGVPNGWAITELLFDPPVDPIAWRKELTGDVRYAAN